jgi:hypothetical protein
MFAAAGDGTLLPLYVCYKAKEMYDTWRENGPPGTRYNRSPSGWFSSEIFHDWFTSIAVPYFRRVLAPGPKVLIGDNLASHISFAIMKEAMSAEINFVFLPPNSTHLCQPLDFSVFKPVKTSWKSVLKEWKQKNKGSLPKCLFPSLLKETISRTTNMKKNILSGFQNTGIMPFNSAIVLEKIVDKEDCLEIGKKFLKPVIDVLHSARLASSQFLSFLGSLPFLFSCFCLVV